MVCGSLKVLLVSLISFTFVANVLSQIGDSCQTNTGAEGICRLISHCPSAIRNIGRRTNVICGYRGRTSIVCCEGSSRGRAPTNRASGGNVRNERKAEAMCRRYSIYAYEKNPSPSLFTSSSFSNVLECPIKARTLIKGGVKASQKEFPHMVQIGFRSVNVVEWNCGGSLISPTFVLTAGHCLRDGERGDPKVVRAGITSQSDTAFLQQRNIAQLIPSPQYNYQKYHDIGLIRVEREFDLNTHIRPACLYTQKNIPTLTAIATGWGKTDFEADEGSEDLMKVTLEMYTTAKCNELYETELPMGIIEDYMVCAGHRREKKDTCPGDSGGPLQIVRHDTPGVKCMYNIIGVTSFGVACGLGTDLPSVYTRVSNYIDWIENTVWPN